MVELTFAYALFYGGHAVALLLLILASLGSRPVSRNRRFVIYGILVAQAAIWILAANAFTTGHASGSERDKSLVPIIAGAAMPFPAAYLWMYFLSRRRRFNRFE